MERRGVALIMTLWILAFLSVLAASYTSTIRLGTAAVRNFKEDASAYYRAVAAFEEAVAYLSDDDDPTVDFTGAGGLFQTGIEHLPFQRLREYPDGIAEVEIVDLDARINLNKATPDLVERMLAHAGYEDERVREAVDSLLDWRDPDDEHRLNGAESDYYDEQTPAYPAKNGPLDAVEELRLIRGFGPAALEGSVEEGTSGLADHITVRSGGALNINTVTPETMGLLGLTNLDVESVQLARSEEAGPIRSVNAALFPGRPDLVSLMRTTASLNLRIIASAANVEGTNRHTIIGDVRRRSRPGGGYNVDVLYWKDDAI